MESARPFDQVRVVLVSHVHGWPETEGTIVSSYKAIRSTDAGRMEDAEIIYEYEVRGKRYRNDRIQAGGDVSSTPSKKTATDADKALAKYPIGAQVIVYHHPRLPQIACLERSDWTAVLIGFVFGPLTIAVGYYLLD